MAATLIASQRIDADVLAVVLLQFALIHVQHEAGREAQLLHGTIRNELDIHLICVGSKERERERERWVRSPAQAAAHSEYSLDVRWQLVATEASDQLGVAVRAIAYLDVVIDAAIVLLQLEGLEFECHLMMGRSNNPPDALLVGHVLQRIVR